MTNPIRPFIPPRTVDIEPCGGALGSDPEHFIVEEIPAYTPSGEGEHIYLWVEKRGLTTPDVAKRIAEQAGLRERDVGYAGLKDKHAITRQWFSIVSKAENADSWDLGSGARILEATRHANKIRTGHLIGNRFSLTLVGIRSPERAASICEVISTKGIVNYFGPQRFGHEGRNVERALSWLEQEAGGQGRDRSRSRRRGGRFENKMYPSVIQSEVFNRYASRRVLLPQVLLLGEVVRLAGTGSHFVVEDLAQELPRKESGDLVLTGPIFGPKGRQADADAARLEREILDEVGMTTDLVEALGRAAPGTRRDLLVRPDGMQMRREGEDDIVVDFSLPAGSYATEVARQFTGADFFEPRLEVTPGAEAPPALT